MTHFFRKAKNHLPCAAFPKMECIDLCVVFCHNYKNETRREVWARRKETVNGNPLWMCLGLVLDFRHIQCLEWSPYPGPSQVLTAADVAWPHFFGRGLFELCNCTVTYILSIQIESSNKDLLNFLNSNIIIKFCNISTCSSKGFYDKSIRKCT